MRFTISKTSKFKFPAHFFLLYILTETNLGGMCNYILRVLNVAPSGCKFVICFWSTL